MADDWGKKVMAFKGCPFHKKRTSPVSWPASPRHPSTAWSASQGRGPPTSSCPSSTWWTPARTGPGWPRREVMGGHAEKKRKFKMWVMASIVSTTICKTEEKDLSSADKGWEIDFDTYGTERKQVGLIFRGPCISKIHKGIEFFIVSLQLPFPREVPIEIKARGPVFPRRRKTIFFSPPQVYTEQRARVAPDVTKSANLLSHLRQGCHFEIRPMTPWGERHYRHNEEEKKKELLLSV